MIVYSDCDTNDYSGSVAISPHQITIITADSFCTAIIESLDYHLPPLPQFAAEYETQVALSYRINRQSWPGQRQQYNHRQMLLKPKAIQRPVLTRRQPLSMSGWLAVNGKKRRMARG